MVLAAVSLGYLAVATGFYVVIAKTAPVVEEEVAQGPVARWLTVEDGGLSGQGEDRKAA